MRTAREKEGGKLDDEGAVHHNLKSLIKLISCAFQIEGGGEWCVRAERENERVTLPLGQLDCKTLQYTQYTPYIRID